MKVYLAGPIIGCAYRDCTNWRIWVKDQLAKYDIVGLSPMRSKNYLDKSGVIDKCYDGRKDLNPLAGVISSSRGITTRDRWDVTRSDIVLVNLLGTESVSIGSVMEIAWADLCRIPIVVVMEKGNIHDHPIINQCIGFKVNSLIESVEVIKALLVL